VEAEITRLLARARGVLADFDGVRPGSKLTGTLEPSEVLELARPVFYELGIAASVEGPIGRMALRFQAPGSSPRAFRLAIFSEASKLVLTTRWVPYDDRPLVVRGPTTAQRWDEKVFEKAIAEHVTTGLRAFEEDLASGNGHLDSSGDLLGLDS